MTPSGKMTTTDSRASALPDFKAVLWDMDGTLVHSDRLHKACIQQIGDEIGKPVSDALAARALGVSHRFCYDLLTAELGAFPMDFESWKQRELEMYYARLDEVEPRKAIPEILRHLHERGIKQAIFSNNPRAAIDRTISGFSRFLSDPSAVFPVIISIDDVPAKPEPDGYLLAAKRLGVAPQDCLVIEDSPTGAKAGLAAGCFTIYWPESDTGKELTVTPDLVTQDLGALLLA